MHLTLKSHARHKNGLGGKPYTLAMVEIRDAAGARQDGAVVLFDAPGCIALLDPVALAGGHPQPRDGHLRGGHVEELVRKAIGKVTA